jgi:Lrp/AsnC family leucine-responsive transcriptional regulator
MDQKDKSILQVLGRRAGLTSRQLSKLLDIPISTVHRRIKKLEQKGVILGYKALINYEYTSWPIGVLLQINLEEYTPGIGHISKDIILDALKTYPAIEELIEVQAATFDIIIRARVASLRGLSQLVEQLRGIEGIEEISAAIITDEVVLPPATIVE